MAPIGPFHVPSSTQLYLLPTLLLLLCASLSARSFFAVCLQTPLASFCSASLLRRRLQHLLYCLLFKTKDQPLSTNTMRILPLSRPLQLLFFYSVSLTQSPLLLPHPLLCCPLLPLLSSSRFQVYFFISSCCNFLLLAKSCVVVVFATYTFSFSIFIIAKVAHPSRRPTKDSFLPAAPLPSSLHHVRVTPFFSSINLAARPCRAESRERRPDARYNGHRRIPPRSPAGSAHQTVPQSARSESGWWR